MYYLQGFMQILPFVDNTLDRTAPVGELSDHARTYAKDKGLYTDLTAAPNVELTSFYSANEADTVAVYPDVATNALKIGQFIYNRARTGATTSDAEALRQNILAEFQGTVKTITLGEMVAHDTMYAPSWIAYEDVSHESHNNIRIWFSDTAFRSQYSHYQIEVIAPITDVDDFFLDPLDVKALLEKYDVTAQIERTNDVRGEYPYTYLKIRDYKFQNKLNKATKYKTEWFAIVWGEAGNNQDAIKTAIQDYVLAHSKHTKEEWAEIMPELFLNTEYVIVPFWHKYAIPNKTLQAGIYAPTICPSADIDTVRKAVKGTGFDDTWIQANTEYAHNIYKSLAYASVGNSQNQNNIFRLSELYTDYIVVTNDSGDFNRMSVKTQTFYQQFSDMLKIAETMTDTSSVTRAYPRLIRDGVVYVSTNIENINFLVVTKYSINKLLGIG